MTRLLATYAAIQVLGLAALPLAFAVCRQLPDRGTSVAKALGLLSTGLTLWLGVSHGLLRNDLGGALLATAAVGLASVGAGARALARDASGRRPLLVWLRAQKTMLLAQEAVFALVFVLWALVRAHDPSADHTEQPMDLMFVTASTVSPTLPLPDPWLAGYPVSYYYFGHWLVALLGRLAALPPEAAYTLGQATWYGLLALGCFGLVSNLVRVHAPAVRPRRAVAAGVLGAASVALAGNLQGLLDVAQRAGVSLEALASGRARHNFSPPSEHWWWWRSSRVLADVGPDGAHLEVIDEVPAFSYVLGDDHPHVLAQPFVALALALALNRFLARGRPGATEAALLVAVVAAVAFVNTADLPAVAVLVLAATWAAAHREGASLRTAVAAAIGLGLGLAVLLAPFLLTAQGQVQGLLPNAIHPTPLWQLVLMFGSLLPGLLLLLDPATRADRRTLAIAVGLCVLLPLGAVAAILALAGDARALAIERGARDPWSLVAVGVLVGVLAARLWSRSGGPSVRAAWAAAALGGGLVLAPELVYLHDGFGTRMNTVFKLYYQAWLLLGLAAAFALATAWDDASRVRRWVARAGSVAAGAGLLFTAAAAWDVTRGFSSPAPSFDALASVPADERAAIDWVRANLAPGTRVLQSVGRSYAPEEARLSVATGRPTLLGWDGHELQWRGRAFGAMAAGRGEAAQAVYASGDRGALLAALDAWQVRYVFVGPAERRRYGMDPAAEQRLRDALDVAFEQGDARVYRRRVWE
jgi:YYY domain-containing protein